MPLPVALDTPIGLYRGDSVTLAFPFYDPPAAWASGTAYVAGVVASGVYLADSTCTYAGLRYTCTTAHTAGASFDATKWTADPAALGPPADLTGIGTVLTAQCRQSPDKPVLFALDVSASNLAGGVITVDVHPADWPAIAEVVVLGFDVQLASADGLQVTTLVQGQLAVTKDFTYTSYGA